MFDTGDLVKIVRNGECFWVVITYITRRKIYATVDSYVIMQPFHRGDCINFLETEIIDKSC